MSGPASESACRVLVGLLEARTGQSLAANRIWRIETALQPILRRRGIADLDGLVGRLLGGEDGALVDAVVDAMLNNESYFFRDHAVFAQLDDTVLEDIRARNAGLRTLSIWCAGCSTGQEAYSLAMLFAGAPHKWNGWTIRLIGTDVSHGAISRAKAGLYSHFEIQRGLPVTLMVRWFEQGDHGWQIGQELRNRVRFARHNLLSDPPPAGPFDLILCRNVLLYFAPSVRRQVFATLHSRIAPHGHLVLGAGETVLGQTEAFVASRIHRGLYQPVAGAVVGGAVPATERRSAIAMGR